MSRLLTFVVLMSLVECTTAQTEIDMKHLESEFSEFVSSTVKRYCQTCHSAAKKEGNLDLSRFADFSRVRNDPKTWTKVAEQLAANEMPPKEQLQLPDNVKQKLLRWVKRYLDAEALANAGDPGAVGIRRLNNAEYKYAVQDLTGIPLNPTATFPVDNAAGEGFTNAVGALGLSPSLLSKYMTAAKEVASHVVLLPDGFRFSIHTTRSDWTKELLQEIREIHEKHVTPVPLGLGTSVGVHNLHGNCQMGQLGKVDPAPYLAAIRANSTKLMQHQTTIDSVAKSAGVNKIYLQKIWDTVATPDNSILLADLARELKTSEQTPEKIAQSIHRWQRGLWAFNPVGLKGRKGSRARWMEPVDPTMGSQEFRLKLQPDSQSKHVVVSLVAADWTNDSRVDRVQWQRPRLVSKGKPDVLLKDVRGLAGLGNTAFGHRSDGTKGEPDSLYAKSPSTLTLRIPNEIAKEVEFVVTAKLDLQAGASGGVQVDVVNAEHRVAKLQPPEINVHLSTVTALYPETRTVSVKRPILVAAKGRRAAELKRAFSDFRRLFPPSFCYPQIVPADEVLTLVPYYREDEPLQRLLLSDREVHELNRLWRELKFVSEEPVRFKEVVDSLVETLLGHPQEGGVDGLIEPARDGLVAYRQQKEAAVKPQLDAVVDFAERAYRRPLKEQESQELKALYLKLKKDGLEHDRAIQLTLCRVLMAAPFLHRIEKQLPSVKSSAVSDHELATRLSFFLWSSIPDFELRKLADKQGLRDPKVLKSQTLRMMRNSKIRRFAVEFAGQWLDVYDFTTVQKSRKVFPKFADYRADMREELIRFVTHAFQSDATLQSLLTSDHTFVNGQLAEFYGIHSTKPDDWVRVAGMHKVGRGGILGMAAPLAKHSSSERSSPILRGNWVVETLLGDRLPRPPIDVPELPQSATDGLSIRQMVERHSMDPACAKCHKRIDPIGFALEQFDGIGRRRLEDSSSKSIDTKTRLDDGTRIDGIRGLRDHLTTTEYPKFVRQFCRKLLGYALGRETTLSDRPLLKLMEQKMLRPDARLSEAILTVINSRQFLEIRGLKR